MIIIETMKHLFHVETQQFYVKHRARHMQVESKGSTTNFILCLISIRKYENINRIIIISLTMFKLQIHFRFQPFGASYVNLCFFKLSTKRVFYEMLCFSQFVPTCIHNAVF